VITIRCIECGTLASAVDWRCTVCTGALDIVELPTFDADAIDEDDFSLWRYNAMLPVEKHVSLGEGMTPLTTTRTDDGTNVMLKLEYLNPTGSYKDRGTVTMMNHLHGQGVTEVVEDSSGNAGASVAAYSSALGIHSQIFVPATGSPAKKALIRAFGAELMEIEGEQYAKTEACEKAAENTPYASHAWSPYFVLGQSTVAWEVWEQMGRDVPDAIVTPLGHGGLFLGFARGFKALLDAGLIKKMPRLYAIQATNSDPIVQGYEQEATIPPRVQTSQTIADGIIVDVPVRGKAVLSAIYSSGGAAFRVSEEEIAQAKDALWQRGFIAEATSSVTWAALPQVQAHHADNQRIVLTLTGNALKNVGLI